MATLESVSKTPTPPQPVTPTSCRRAAADYIGVMYSPDVTKWITSGMRSDLSDAADDLIELADLLFATAQRACRDGVMS